MKYAALALDVGEFGSNVPFFLRDLDLNLSLYTSEKQALKDIKENFATYIVLIGMIDDPTPIYNELKAEQVNEQRKKEKVTVSNKKTTNSPKKTTKVLKNPKKPDKKTKQRASRDNDSIISL